MAQFNDPFSLSPLSEKMRQDIELTGRGKRTQESYVRAVRKFSEFLKKCPSEATEDDLRNYLLFVKNEREWSSSTLNVAYCGIKFFYKITVPRDWPTLRQLRVPPEIKLPTVLSLKEVQILLKVIEKPCMKCFFTAVYSMGLRLQEGLNLQISDIDSKRMMVHIHRGKGARDRLVPLPESTLKLLRDYYRTHRNTTWIFPAEGRGHQGRASATKPMSETSVQGCIVAVFKDLGWENRGLRTHTLRHCYATHLLEAGVSIKTLQKYLGHKVLTSTMVYLHVTSVGALQYLAPYVFRIAIGNHRIKKVEDGPDGLGRVTCNEHQTTIFKTKVYSRILALTPIPSPKNPRSTEDFRARGAHMFFSVISCKVGFLKGDFSRHTKHI